MALRNLLLNRNDLASQHSSNNNISYIGRDYPRQSWPAKNLPLCANCSFQGRCVSEPPMFKQALRDLLPKLMKQLMRQAGAKTQTRFAEVTQIDLGRINRYVNKKELPDEKLPQLAEGSGLVSKEVLWLFGHLMEREYADYKFELVQADEADEPKAHRGGPNLAVRIEAMMEMDLSGIEPHSQVALRRQRQAIYDFHNESQGSHQLTALRTLALVDTFEETCAAARRSPGFKDS